MKKVPFHDLLAILNKPVADPAGRLEEVRQGAVSSDFVVARGGTTGRANKVTQLLFLFAEARTSTPAARI